jgi:hypothetical protein
MYQLVRSVLSSSCEFKTLQPTVKDLTNFAIPFYTFYQELGTWKPNDDGDCGLSLITENVIIGGELAKAGTSYNFIHFIFIISF